VLPKINAAHNQAARGERLHLLPHRAEAHTTVLSSRLVALSRCPDADYILRASAIRWNGPKVLQRNQSSPMRIGFVLSGLQGDFSGPNGVGSTP
jgi:hypothetical protein